MSDVTATATPAIHSKTREYYARKVAEHGPSACGVDWKDAQSQQLRFDRLLLHLGDLTGASFLDVGCGTGDLVTCLQGRAGRFEYLGIDWVPEMIAHGRCLHSDGQRITFENTSLENVSRGFDFAVASGIFNVKMDVPETDWMDYILRTLDGMNRVSQRGFSFNVLTSFVDFEADHLYYCNPMKIFEHCKQNFSREVMLDHLYPLYEFTITVLKTT